MIPLIPTLLGVALALALAFGGGYKVRGYEERALQLEVERGWHEKYRQGVAEAQAAAEVAGLALRRESSARADESAKIRAELAASRRSGTVRLATCDKAVDVPRMARSGGEVAHVAAPSREVGGDSVVLTPDFRLRYDTALSLVVPASDRAGWLETAGAAPGSADLWTVLDNATENAGRWAQCREQMTAAQLWFKQMGWVK